MKRSSVTATILGATLLSTIPAVVGQQNRDVQDDGPVERGGPIILKHAAAFSAPKNPPEGFRSLFDGKTLNGWTAMPRLPVPRYPGAPIKWRLAGDQLETAKQCHVTEKRCLVRRLLPGLRCASSLCRVNISLFSDRKNWGSKNG